MSLDFLPVLPVRLIAWVFTVAGLAALALGALTLNLLKKADRLPSGKVDYSIWNDILLLGVWAISFIAGMGLLNHKPWAPTMLEYFCWVLGLLTLLSAATRIKIMKEKFAADPTAPPFRMRAAVVGAAIVVIPVTLLCAVTIRTLHDEGVREELRAASQAASQPRN